MPGAGTERRNGRLMEPNTQFSGEVAGPWLLLRMPAVSRLLERFGVLCRWRAAMVLELDALTDRPELPKECAVRAWEDTALSEVARLDYAAYQGTLDANLYWQYFSSVEGCRRMWTEAIAGKFGRFDPARTLLLYCGGELVGDVMASIRNPREAFIGNLAVLPEWRGGLGAALLLECLWRYREAGFNRVSLAVTLDNKRAFQLYTRLGFKVSTRFLLITRPRPAASRMDMK